MKVERLEDCMTIEETSLINFACLKSKHFFLAKRGRLEENFIYEIEELLNLMIMQFALSLHCELVAGHRLDFTNMSSSKFVIF